MMEILFKEQDKWINMLKVMGCSLYDAEDLVHDMYIKISEMDNPDRIMYNETEVNHWYIYMTLRSIYINFINDNKKRGESVDIDLMCGGKLRFEEFDEEKEEAWERLYWVVSGEINGFGRYGSKLTQVYFKTNISLRKMAVESDISLTSLFNSIKKYRQHLVEEFGEDWEDFNNGDYDKI